jgi:beta-glucosidase
VQRKPLLPVFATRAAFGGGLTLVALACSHLTPDPNQNNYPGDDGGITWPITFDGGTQVVSGDAAPGPKMACGDSTYSDPWTPGYTPDKKSAAIVQALVNEMTVTELADQMRGTTNGGGSNYADIFRTYDDPTKDIRGWHFRDGPRGACINAELPAGKDGYSTAFPVPEARAAAFDMDLEEKIGEAIGEEVLTSTDPLTGSPNTMVLAPMINIVRHPAWGRAQETYGEDSFELGRLGTAFTVGAQQYIAACAKHFAAYDIEDGRASLTSVLDEQTLREHYARHFGMVIEDSGVACIMSSYNLTNRGGGPIKASLDKHLITDILRNDFNFQGLVLTDWWALPPGTAFATTDSLQANAATAVNAGLDLELPWSYNYDQLEALAVPNGEIQLSQLFTSAQRVLTQKFRFNVGSLTRTTVGLRAPATVFSGQYSIENEADHVALAHKAEIEGAVLLKNDNATLPINRSTVKTIAVLGSKVNFTLPFGNLSGTVDFSQDIRLGDLGSSRVYSDPAKSSGPFAGIKNAAGTGITVVQGNDASAAANADFVVVVVGLTAQDEGEEYTGAGDRQSFALDAKSTAPMQPCSPGSTTMCGTQDALVNAVAALNKPMVVVIEAGSVVDTSKWPASVHAVVMAWYPGMDGGSAIGQLLFGDANFSGKLPLTWPVSWNDEPIFVGPGGITPFDYYVGYQYFDHYMKQPLYAFGHGLSYTTFKYENLQVPCSTVTNNGIIYVQADITNSGTVAGDEVAFLFVTYPDMTTVRRPVKELKAFQRVSLNPGETRRVTLPVRVSDLKYWDTGANAWHPFTGTLGINVGGSSDNLPLKDTVTVQ